MAINRRRKYKSKKRPSFQQRVERLEKRLKHVKSPDTRRLLKSVVQARAKAQGSASSTPVVEKTPTQLKAEFFGPTIEEEDAWPSRSPSSAWSDLDRGLELAPPAIAAQIRALRQSKKQRQHNYQHLKARAEQLDSHLHLLRKTMQASRRKLRAMQRRHPWLEIEL
eukprot:TRINITY_DN10466_c0_g1_i12.p1 TRINITY_DN10466_c0_g1~~TRINITY_DN10466_c0_g1_i12.p1  ORF type:complete len:166 (+),score=28.90 TRINITY_DN10466_c0_g1_i12:1289-1786(+)